MAESDGGTQVPVGASITERPQPLRQPAELGPPKRDRLHRHTEPGGQLGIALVDEGKELLARHQQRPGERLRPPLVERPLLEPSGHPEGVQRQSAGETHQRVTLLKLRQREQRRVQVDLVSPGKRDRPALVRDQLHTPIKARGRPLRPPLEKTEPC